MTKGRLIRVAGVTFEGRQRKIKKINEGDRAKLLPEPDNPADPYAIRVLVGGKQVGYIPKKIARSISETWDLYLYFARVESVFEGDDHPDHKRSWGLRIRMFKMKRR